MRADRNGCERRPYRQPLWGDAEVADLGQVEQSEHLPGLGPPAHTEPAIGAREDELVEEGSLPAPDRSFGHDAAVTAWSKTRVSA